MLSFTHIVSDIDRALFLALNNGLKCRALDEVMPLVTDLGLGHIQALAILVVAYLRGISTGETRGQGWLLAARNAIYDRRRWVGPMLVAIALVGILAPAIKFLSGDRPTEFYRKEHSAGRLLSERPMTVQGVKNIRVARFPSGHTATSVALASIATILFWWERKRLLLAGLWLLAAAIGFSRVYLADHWPLDVAGGVALGVCVGWWAIRLCERRARVREKIAARASADV